nr:hypothetical protein [Microbacterium sp.]
MPAVEVGEHRDGGIQVAAAAEAYSAFVRQAQSVSVIEFGHRACGVLPLDERFENGRHAVGGHEPEERRDALGRDLLGRMPSETSVHHVQEAQVDHLAQKAGRLAIGITDEHLQSGDGIGGLLGDPHELQHPTVDPVLVLAEVLAQDWTIGHDGVEEAFGRLGVAEDRPVVILEVEEGHLVARMGLCVFGDERQEFVEVAGAGKPDVPSTPGHHPGMGVGVDQAGHDDPPAEVDLHILRRLLPHRPRADERDTPILDDDCVGHGSLVVAGVDHCIGQDHRHRLRPFTEEPRRRLVNNLVRNDNKLQGA